MTIKSIEKEIKSLEFYLGEENGNPESVLYVIKSLEDTLETVHNQNWDGDTIRDYVLSDNDPIDEIDGVSESFRENVREIQHGIISYFS